MTGTSFHAGLITDLHTGCGRSVAAAKDRGKSRGRSVAISAPCLCRAVRIELLTLYCLSNERQVSRPPLQSFCLCRDATSYNGRVCGGEVKDPLYRLLLRIIVKLLVAEAERTVRDSVLAFHNRVVLQ